MSKLPILLVGNGPNTNRGCEAIARGTSEMFAAAGYPVAIRSGVISSDVTSAGPNAAPGRDDTAPPTFPIRLKPSRTLLDRIRARIPGQRVRYHASGLRAGIGDSLFALEVGGDNYTLDYGPPWAFVDLDRRLKALGLPVFIWGASVGPFDSKPKVRDAMVRHFNSLNGVFVRESASFADLSQSGVTNAYQMTDPAMFMSATEPKAPGFELEAFANAIGLNLSPFQAQALSKSGRQYWETTDEELGQLIDFSRNLIRKLLELSGRRIVLVPHVFGPAAWNDDHWLLSKVRDGLDDAERSMVALPSRDLSSPELKWIISQCVVFAGSRTHSTLAAISSGVPTVAYGYSRKSKGLMQDIYGEDSMNIRSADFNLESASSAVMKLLEGKDGLRNRIAVRLPELKQRGLEAVRQLMKELPRG